MSQGRHLTAQERAALALYLIVAKPRTTAHLAYRLGLSESGAYRLLANISRVVPIVQIDGKWQICP